MRVASVMDMGVEEIGRDGGRPSLRCMFATEEGGLGL
jgi:hypothetical protein